MPETIREELLLTDPPPIKFLSASLHRIDTLGQRGKMQSFQLEPTTHRGDPKDRCWKLTLDWVPDPILYVSPTDHRLLRMYRDIPILDTLRWSWIRFVSWILKMTSKKARQ